MMTASAASLAVLLLPGARTAGLFALALAFGLVLVALLARHAWRGGAPGGQAGLERALLHAAAVAAAAAGASHALWLAAQAQAFSGASDAQAWRQALAATAAHTAFGHGWTARALLLAGFGLALAWLARRRRPAGSRTLAALAAAAALALALQVRAGHAAGAGDPWPAVALAVHVLAASAWIGALPGLLLVVAWSDIPPQSAARVLMAFSRFASAVVAALLACGLGLALYWIGGPMDGLGGWLGTAYGRAALAKTGLAVLLLALAALHRWWLAPRLHAGSAFGRRALLAGIGIELLAGLAAFAVAGHLASRPPAVHEQPLWPFPQRPDPRAWGDAYARRELWRAAALAAVALLALGAVVLAARWRRARWPARSAAALAALLGAAALAAALGWPNARLWLRPAYATSYQHSPTGYSAESIARGQERVRRDCRIDCFTAEDDATDLSPYNIWGRGDGDLHGWLLATFDTLGHSPFAHGYIGALEALQRWQLIDYFRARVAGRAVDAQGAWRGAYPAPGLALDCRGGPARIEGLRGRMVRIVASAGGASAGVLAPLPAGIDALTIILAPGSRPPGPPGGGSSAPDCRATGDDAWAAYALAAGLAPDRLDGAEIVIDARGWLRQRWTAPAWPSGPAREVVLRAIQAEPLAADMPLGHRH